MSIPVIGLDNGIISGHQRLKILQALGRDDEVIDVRVPNRALTTAETAEAVLRENKNTGEWDFDILANWDEDLLKDVGFENLIIDGRSIDDKRGSNYFDSIGKGKAYFAVGECGVPVDYQLLKSAEVKLSEMTEHERLEVMEGMLRI